MQFKFLAPLALAGSAVAGFSNDTTVTEVVTALTTYCPEATTIVTNGKTYTVTSATTLTITDCPCTIVHTTSVAPSTAPKSSASVFTDGAAKIGVAGLAAAAGAAVYLL
ncbi:hypothetical protein PICMEDRAFT_74095 [Pichia membranifaciens NRRL Y-2026]|uniref:Clock-controlled protein 6 n=1 Tax=Pichia membranifaciens NRRL Y-2026 TaxID=763406 RepID=A0A1E3NGS5_9ASCO|nr:hypothetical protein PICMEDRAFT_74095 [Pichia membranifaciens NRRL Y-2026]ODQ45331.1 hypothetical protein PICMEDRAFT_74095 [Pichia membranifaciens NRRL Y-2026]